MVMLPTLIIAGKMDRLWTRLIWGLADDCVSWLADWLAGMLATGFTDLMRLYCG
jgi:hypothetical protein